MTTKAHVIIARLEASLTPLGAFRSRAMFGGHGLYLNDLFFGLIAYDTLYLKTDETNRSDYVKAHSKPFSFESNRKGLVTTSYWQCPAETFKDMRKLRRWVGKALDAARRAKSAKPKRAPRKKDFPF
ncbi:TfoX/Sxy family protein [Dongia deserti]|uniref:TfoX/Sxy family protein n=1 Tax=Dongia deserti TaxID=2268030 RepID=UPI0013C5274D|nr:TfoX/Sxy family protein [Dongia deserti]